MSTTAKTAVMSATPSCRLRRHRTELLGWRAFLLTSGTHRSQARRKRRPVAAPHESEHTEQESRQEAQAHDGVPLSIGRMNLAEPRRRRPSIKDRVSAGTGT